MKKYIILGTLLLTGMIYAQGPKPVLEPFGTKVKATFFHNNGQLMQEGYFVKGKLDGTWVSYDESGNLLATAEYRNGEKVGKWFFWSEINDKGFSSLYEVDYANNKIASVRNWKKDAIVSN